MANTNDPENNKDKDLENPFGPDFCGPGPDFCGPPPEADFDDGYQDPSEIYLIWEKGKELDLPEKKKSLCIGNVSCMMRSRLKLFFNLWKQI